MGMEVRGRGGWRKLFKGKEVAAFVEKHFLEELLKNKNFQSKQFAPALRETFLKMDDLMNTP